MIYPLSKNKKTNFLSASSGYYTEEYAQRMFNHYLQTELISDEYGNVKKYYRLYAKEDHPQDMALAYNVQCPDCKGTLKQVGRQLTFNKLGLYQCPHCEK
ncbi:hypothetical protein DWY90_10915 [Coprococcus sp. AF27-8]|nr:hypothetical protein DWY90_10915 [Coprococcus sp. AF27-8]